MWFDFKLDFFWMTSKWMVAHPYNFSPGIAKKQTDSQYRRENIVANISRKKSWQTLPSWEHTLPKLIASKTDDIFRSPGKIRIKRCDSGRLSAAHVKQAQKELEHENDWSVHQVSSIDFSQGRNCPLKLCYFLWIHRLISAAPLTHIHTHTHRVPLVRAIALSQTVLSLCHNATFPQVSVFHK